MRHELDKDEYPDHYKELGKQLSIIDNVTSISDLIRKLDREIIVSPLAIVGEDEILDETFNNIILINFKLTFTRDPIFFCFINKNFISRLIYIILGWIS